MIDTSAIRRRDEAIAAHRDERSLRLFAASEARAARRGGIAAVSQMTRIARSTIGSGLRDLDSAALAWPSGRVRRSGGGRKAAAVEQPGLLEALTKLIASAIRGDPQAALLGGAAASDIWPGNWRSEAILSTTRWWDGC